MLQKTLRKLCPSRIILWCKAKHASWGPASWIHTNVSYSCDSPRVSQGVPAPVPQLSLLFFTLCTANSKAPLFLRCQSMLAHVCMFGIWQWRSAQWWKQCTANSSPFEWWYVVYIAAITAMCIHQRLAQNSKWIHTAATPPPPPLHVAHSDTSCLNITKKSLIEETW
jgi:hypothetical protein